MSAFSDLCHEAQVYGAKELTFRVDLPKFSRGLGNGEVGLEGSWTCIALGERDLEAKAEGRTGEEALRRVVYLLGNAPGRPA